MNFYNEHDPKAAAWLRVLIEEGWDIFTRTGSGTTGMVALELGRKAILCELNPDYIKLIEQRTNVTPGLQLA